MAGPSVRAVLLIALSLGACAGDKDNLLDHCEYLRSLTVTDAHGLELWRVEAIEPTKACKITYAQTPAHFKQTVPYSRPPRNFAPDERVKIELIMADGWIREDCNALTPTTLICAGYIAGPLPRRGSTNGTSTQPRPVQLPRPEPR